MKVQETLLAILVPASRLKEKEVQWGLNLSSETGASLVQRKSKHGPLERRGLLSECRRLTGFHCAVFAISRVENLPPDACKLFKEPGCRKLPGFVCTICWNS